MEEQNLKTISEYEIFRRDVEKINPRTIEMQSLHLKKLAESLGEILFKEASEKQIIEHQSKYAPATQNTILAILRNFYRWIFNLDKDDKLPDCIRRIKLHNTHKDEPTYRERVIIPEEYEKMLNFAKDNMHKAMIETLYNFGTRVSELLSMSAIDATYDGEFTRITVRESKTRTRIVTYHGRLNHLMNWAETYHPFKNDKNTPMWINTFHGTNDRFTRRGILNLIRRLCKKADIEKKITCHDFRHTSISNDRAKGVPNTHIETKHGLIHGSLVMQVYDHNKNGDYEKWMRKDDTTPKEDSYITLKAKTTQIEKQGERISELENTLHDALITIKSLMEATTGSKSTL